MSTAAIAVLVLWLAGYVLGAIRIYGTNRNLTLLDVVVILPIVALFVAIIDFCLGADRCLRWAASVNVLDAERCRG